MACRCNGVSKNARTALAFDEHDSDDAIHEQPVTSERTPEKTPAQRQSNATETPQQRVAQAVMQGYLNNA
jgi:hypothetical protein